MGESGSGKTTLLNILAALDRPTEGKVMLCGEDTAAVKESKAAYFRRENLGFVFQDFNLLDNFTVRDNIFLPLVLSGGQKQRTAAARALITSPKLLLADEPTGSLDSRSAEELLSLFDNVNRAGQTILMVTHSVKAASSASRVLFIKDGTVFHQIYRGGCTNEQLYLKISDTLTALATGGDI